MKKKKLLKKLHKLESKKLKKMKKKLKSLEELLKNANEQFKENNDYDKFVTLYTDASYDQVSHACAYGIVAVPYTGNTVEVSGTVKSPRPDIRVDCQLGEATAIIKAIEWAKKNGFTNVRIYTDNTNVVLWSKFGNGIDNVLANWFYERYTNVSKDVVVSINWMKRRTCDYNRNADNLARKEMSIARANAPRKAEKLSGGKLCTLGELCDFSKLLAL